MQLPRFATATSLILHCSKAAIGLNSGVRPIIRQRFSGTRFKQTRSVRNEKQKLHTYVIQQYIDYVKNYTNVVQARFPTAVKMYRVFSVGIKEFLRDLQRYTSLRIKVTKHGGFSNMSREDIEFYQKMPSDMIRIAPVLILTAIPFGNYIIFPLAFFKPRTLLCSHFWSIQQRAEFSRLDLTERLRINKTVFRALQEKLDEIPDCILRRKFGRVLASLGSGSHPSPEDLLACKDLFTKEPYGLNYLNFGQMGNLLRLHGMKNTLRRRNKLIHRAFLLLEMDRAIVREGGVDTLSTDALKYACHIRGLNGSNLANQDMKNWLNKWLQISLSIDKSAYSLLLHCPVFLGYNHPQNWVLIYKNNLIE